MNSKSKNEYNKQWRIKNKDKMLEYQKKYTLTEKGKASRQRSDCKRRAIDKNIINTLTSDEWLNILKEYNYKCAYCGCEFNENNMPTREHIIPVSKGGQNVKENIIPACISCNSKKLYLNSVEGFG
jgi:5-methylcytosine-specific restriction endonuclease McrA